MTHARIFFKRKAAAILIVVLAAALVVPLALASSPRDAAAQGGSVLRIGYLGMRGSETANGAQLAIDEINAIGGVTAVDGAVYRLELVPLDGPVTLDTLPAALNTLTEQSVVAILGPDTNALITRETIDALTALRVPILTPATGDALTDIDQTDFIFRTRAPEVVMSRALAAYLAQDLGLATFAAVQTDVEFTEALIDFETALGSQDRTLATKIQIPGGSALSDQVPGLLQLNPDAVVMWGDAKDAGDLLSALRNGGWDGIFAYRRAGEAVRSGLIPASLANGVIGFDSWSFGDPSDASRIFLREYVVNFGQIPSPMAVAAYDAVWFLRFAIMERGASPAQLQAGLIGGSPRTLVQGALHPIEFLNGDLARMAEVYQIGPHGGPTVVARYDDTRRLRLDEAGGPVTTPEPAQPTQPAETPVPTATLEGTWVQVTVNTLNVRNGPGSYYDKIGQIKLGDLNRVLGVSPDYAWVAIDFNGSVGWVAVEYVTVLGDLASITVIQPPATPTPAPSPTITISPNPDIVIDTVVLSPTQPVPGKPFSATVMVRNAGSGAAGRFAVAATWLPGNAYSATFVDGLAGGQTIQVQLSATINGTGVFNVAVVADLNNEVAEADEGNNNYTVTYRADYPLFANQSGLQINVGTDWDLFGGTPDLNWDGYTLWTRGGSTIALIQGIPYDNVTYDQLGSLPYDAVGAGPDKVTTGAVLGMITAEGKRAVLRVDNVQGGGPVWLSYRVYNDTP